MQVTIVVPSGRGEPEGGLQATVGVPQLSVAVGLGKVTILLAPIGHEAAAPVAMFAGQVIVGASVSMTFTWKVQLAPASVPQLTVVVPTGKKEPGAGRQVTVPQPVPVVIGMG